ncbi:putative Late nodulin [Medicago truncatula]|uniref:Nodule Cysteine-Rich (NCR) secreted peptide n=1 Tax=Medicago truncatula TaxID=3880 RepID=G7JY89_MEDTR|nr:Nodule Cysteine-Rich (NCR) secreted peptide [Medicago truncatula]RHN55663.1 putative Late nodulin [Medicago truncatula]
MAHLKFVYVMILFLFLFLITKNIEAYKCNIDVDCPITPSPKFKWKCINKRCLYIRFDEIWTSDPRE